MFANIGPWQLLIILVIVLAIFGTKKLRNLGSDLGGAVKGFRSAMNEAEQPAEVDDVAQVPDYLADIKRQNLARVAEFTIARNARETLAIIETAINDPVA